MKLKILIPVLLLAVILAGCTQPGSNTNAGGKSGTGDVIQTNQTTTLITEEKAKSIALEHAGFTADQVSNLYISFEYDDGKPEYEVSFHEGYLEYEYEIHAETGTILSYDKDD